MNDPQLDELLKVAQRPPPALPPVFAREVWRDIENRSIYRSAAWMEKLTEFLVQPAPRLVLWAVALGIGLLAGTRSSQPADPAAIYAYSINPLAPAITP